MPAGRGRQTRPRWSAGTARVEGSPPSPAPNPAAGSSWDYRIRRPETSGCQTERCLVPRVWQKRGTGQGEFPRLPAATLPRSVRLPQLTLKPMFRPLGRAAQLTFLGQHGDEGTDELVVVVGSPLVIDLQRGDKSTNNPHTAGRQKGELKANRGQRTGLPGPAHRPGRLEQEGTHLPAQLRPMHNWDSLHPSSDASTVHKGQLGRGEGEQGRNPARPWSRDPPSSCQRRCPAVAQLQRSTFFLKLAAAAAPGASACPGGSSAP